MKNIIISIMSVVVSFLLCVIAIAHKQHWLLAAMMVIGICGVLFVAYLKAKKLIK